ncbi:Rossmann-fold superfamily protein [Perilla frutescens var. hirtella]|uniref:Rossmann-fold superfamily protein n=1 Tax=Perilla frutescens var. hirtella TaxID=608512 RepID=A0AAD4J3X6_PERFH|nr:Rossmann-fold superfamily protein [Perilla frutescens var. hirtella]
MTSLSCRALFPSIAAPSSQSSRGRGRGRALFSFFFGTPHLTDFSHRRSYTIGVKCSYTDLGAKENSNIGTIDVVADVKTERVVVLGGSGFVGSAICKAAVSKGIEVISLSRSGRPSYSDSWVDQVNWLTGDVFYANWDEVLIGATAVVSTLGGVGSEEQMQRINGEANIVAVNAAKEFGE